MKLENTGYIPDQVLSEIKIPKFLFQVSRLVEAQMLRKQAWTTGPKRDTSMKNKTQRVQDLTMLCKMPHKGIIHRKWSIDIKGLFCNM